MEFPFATATGAPIITHPDVIEEHWGEGLRYRGVDIIDSLYPTAEAMCIDDAFPSFDIDEYQECYLGYFPSTDTFAIGFDCDGVNDDDDAIGSALVYFTYEDGRAIFDRIEVDTGSFYSDGGMFETVDHEDVIHLRLD